VFTFRWSVIHFGVAAVLALLISTLRDKFKKLTSTKSVRHLGMIVIPLNLGHLSPSLTTWAIAAVLVAATMYFQSRQKRNNELARVQQLLPEAARRMGNPTASDTYQINPDLQSPEGKRTLAEILSAA